MALPGGGELTPLAGQKLRIMWKVKFLLGWAHHSTTGVRSQAEGRFTMPVPFSGLSAIEKWPIRTLGPQPSLIFSWQQATKGTCLEDSPLHDTVSTVSSTCDTQKNGEGAEGRSVGKGAAF